MEGIIKSISCTPANVTVDGAYLDVLTAICIETDVNALYRDCVNAGFNPADINVWVGEGHDEQTTLAELKESGVASVIAITSMALAVGYSG